MKINNYPILILCCIVFLITCKRDEEYCLPDPLTNEVILYSPDNEVFLQHEPVITFNWSFDRGDLVGPISYNLIITEQLKDDSEQTHVISDIYKSEYNLNTNLFNSASTAFTWRIEMIRDNGVNKSLVKSNMWAFTRANYILPQLISPRNNATGVNNNNAEVFEWSLAYWTDSLISYPINYDFHFGTDPNPPFHHAVSDGNTQPYTVITEPNTTYYWKIVSRDSYYTLGSSPVWSFKTRPVSIGDVELETVFIEGGSYTMGCTFTSLPCSQSEKPAHEVTVNNFYMSKYEITNQNFCAFLNSKGNQTEESVLWYDMDNNNGYILYTQGKYKPSPGKSDHPVSHVTWYGAKAYANWVGGRLPTEAEWEFAARGGNHSNNTQYSGNESPWPVGWCSGGAGSGYEPVGLKLPNELGLYDMSGNVQEWCSDWYSLKYYEESPAYNPQGPGESSAKIARGGHIESHYKDLRVSARQFLAPSKTKSYTGIRIVIPQ